MFDKKLEKSPLMDVKITQPIVSEYLITSNNKLEEFYYLIKNIINEYPELKLII